jgi:hypothetical protein
MVGAGSARHARRAAQLPVSPSQEWPTDYFFFFLPFLSFFFFAMTDPLSSPRSTQR